MNSIVLCYITEGFFKGKFIAVASSILGEKGVESLIISGRLIIRQEKSGKAIFTTQLIQIVDRKRDIEELKNSERVVYRGFLRLASKEEQETVKKLISREWDITDREKLFRVINEVIANHNLFYLLFQEDYGYPENYEIFKGSLEKSFGS